MCFFFNSEETFHCWDLNFHIFSHSFLLSVIKKERMLSVVSMRLFLDHQDLIIQVNLRTYPLHPRLFLLLQSIQLESVERR